ncbi:MAG: U32 family peptidase, partial [Promethearchaeota archaeon]
KDPLYVKTVVECYKEAIDCYFEGTYTEEKVKYWLKKLSKVYNRGFHTGFYFQRPTIENIELGIRGNISPYKKIYLGKILSYDNASRSANVLIENRESFLRVGDQIIIIGKNSYCVEQVKKLILNGTKVKSIVRKTNNNPIKFNLPLESVVECDDKIYILSKK